ncbi:putative membrane protein [Klebsiella oxytoca]|nr:putative membrane protein [Klebsiella oxytoca]
MIFIFNIFIRKVFINWSSSYLFLFIYLLLPKIYDFHHR